MNEDSDHEESRFKGVFHFPANIGDTVIFSYSKAYTVTIMDTRQAAAPQNLWKLKVPKGKSLEEADQFRDVWGDLKAHWTDPATGIEYELAGLKRQTQNWRRSIPLATR